MPTYRVAITDEECVSVALEDHASIIVAQKSVARTAMAFLSEQGQTDCRHIAECEIRQIDGDEDLHFLVAIEIVSLLR